MFAKIPVDREQMFQSGYTIDDLLIGKVGIVGICKGKITPAQMKSPFDYFQQPGDPKRTPQNDIVICGKNPSPTAMTVGGNRAEQGYYIDILAVIQAVSFEA